MSGLYGPGAGPVLEWRMDKKAVSTQLWMMTLTRCPLEAAAWLAGLPSLLSGADFADVFEAVAGRLGRAPVALTARETGALRSLGLSAPPKGWTLTDLGRAALLASASLELPQADFLLLLAQCAAQGERGRQAVLAALCLLPKEQGVPVA